MSSDSMINFVMSSLEPLMAPLNCGRLCPLTDVVLYVLQTFVHQWCLFLSPFCFLSPMLLYARRKGTDDSSFRLNDC